MSRYIDAEALDNRIKAEWAKQEDDKGYGLAHFFVETQPTADVAPVVHARWYYHYRLKKFVCLNCGFEQSKKPNFRFCPKCGAKMDEEEGKL